MNVLVIITMEDCGNLMWSLVLSQRYLQRSKSFGIWRPWKLAKSYQRFWATCILKRMQPSHLILRKAFTNWHCFITQDLDLCGGAFDATVHAEQFHLNGRINRSTNLYHCELASYCQSWSIVSLQYAILILCCSILITMALWFLNLHTSWPTCKKWIYVRFYLGIDIDKFLFSTEKQLRRVEGLTVSELLLTQNTLEFLIRGKFKSGGIERKFLA